MKVVVYSWFGDPEVIAPFAHNEVAEVKDLWETAQGFFDDGYNIMIKHGGEMPVICVSNSGFGMR